VLAIADGGSLPVTCFRLPTGGAIEALNFKPPTNLIKCRNYE